MGGDTARDLHFRDFCTKLLNHFPHLTVPDAVGVVLRHQQENEGKQRVLLCVDEILLCKQWKTVQEELKNLLLDGNIDIVVSSLDAVLLDEAGRLKNETESLRKISWIPLRPISETSSLQLFKKYSPMPADLHAMILFSNGHPRTLAFLESIMRENQDPAAHFLQRTSICGRADLFKKMKEQLAKSYSHFPDWRVVSCGLLHDSVSSKRVIFKDAKGKPYTAHNLVAMGIWLSSYNLDVTKMIQPILSLVHIMSRCVFSDLNADGKITPYKFDFFLEMSRLQVGTGSAIGFWYEEFHTLWEGIIRMAHGPKSLFLVKQFYKIDRNACLTPHHFYKDVEIALFPKDFRRVFDNKNFSLLPDLVQYDPHEPRPSTEDHITTPFEKIHLFGGTNPGFDALIIEKTLGCTSRPVAIFLEYKYSHSSTINNWMSMVDIKNKPAHTLQFFDSHLRGSFSSPLSYTLVLLTEEKN